MALDYQIIYYWPDDIWCTQEELSGMTHKSDDYGTLHVPLDYYNEDIDKEVRFLNDYLPGLE